MQHITRIISLGIAIALLSSCGQKGPLTLPKEPTQTPKVSSGLL